MGLQIVPNHYYSPLADVDRLGKTKKVWAHKSDLPGVAYDLDEQVENIRTICLPFRDEYSGNSNYFKAIEMDLGMGFGEIEAQVLHGVVRHFQPRRIVEVGGGVSTYCMLKALDLNGRGSITCIEPYPSDSLRKLGDIELVVEPVQLIEGKVFTDLSRGDLLYIDSSHTVKPGSDVNHLVLDVLPRLGDGVLVHFHDIYLPYDYQVDVLNTVFQWSETSLLRAFLINNNGVGIIFCLSQLHHERLDDLKMIFPDYDPLLLIDGLSDSSPPWVQQFPSSIYLEISKNL